jgi:hypothetical protein
MPAKVVDIPVPPALPPKLRSHVTHFVRRARRRVALRALGRGAALFIAWALLCCVADRLFQLPSQARVALLLAGVAAVTAVVARPLAALLRRRVDWLRAAEVFERHDRHFSQRLMTVTGQLLGPPEHRGSEDLLFRLLSDVEHEAGARPAARVVPGTSIVLPWLVAAGLVALSLWLAQFTTLGLPTLALRLVAPLADVDPVTTTRLAVTPGNTTLPQSRSLRIDATVTRLPPDAAVWLTWQEEGAAPVRRVMAREAPGRFSFTLPAVGRDLRYRVSAGDGRTREHVVRVLRPPAVASLEVRYAYPPYAGRPPATVTGADGTIEAPAGTEVTLIVTATEPLQSAMLRLPDGKLLMTRAATDPENVRRATFTAAHAGPYELDLISTRQVAGSGPPGTAVRILSDRKPLARLVNAGQTLRLNPRDILPLNYQALDDFGLESLAVRARVSGGGAKEYRIGIDADPRRGEGTFNLDLADLKLGFGDVVSVALVARDRAGQEEASEPLQVLVAPRSIDLETHQRITELETAAQLAGLVAEELEATLKSLGEAQARRVKEPDVAQAAVGRGNRFLTTAAETAVLARQATVRAIVRSRSPGLASALSTLADAVQQVGAGGEEVFQANALSADANAVDETLGRLIERAQKARDSLRAVAQGERAAAILLDRENLAASEKRAAADPQAAGRVRQALQRAAEDVAAGAVGLGLDPAAANVDELLRQKVEAEQAALRAQQPVDFAAAARQWAEALRRDPLRRLALDERLALAAQAEAVRPGSDLARAQDLNICSRAASRVATDAATEVYAGRRPPADAPDRYAAAVAALQREHELDLRPSDVRPPAELKSVRDAAAAARRLLSDWAGVDGQASAADARPAYRRSEDLALRGSAALAGRDYGAARSSDRELLRYLAGSGPDAATTAPQTNPGADPVAAGPPVPVSLRREFDRVDQLTDKAEVIDRVQSDQDKLARQTNSPAAATGAPLLAERQTDVAQRIEEVASHDDASGAAAAIPRAEPAADRTQDPTWRGRATAAVIAAQEQLAALPQQMTTAQEEAAALARATDRLALARREATAAPAERRATLEQTARQADRELQTAERHLRATVLPSLLGAAASVAGGLSSFEPDTAPARELIARQLVPALRDFEQSSLKGDSPAASRAAAAAREAVDAVHRELARAQEEFTSRDPIVAAKWFARAAADSLNRSPPDLQGAYRRQMDTSEALSRAWDRTVHEAAAQRLSLVPSMQGLFRAALPSPFAAGAQAGTDGQARGTARDVASLREWGRLRTRDVEDLNTPLRESETPGYERALQLYFESLSRPAPSPQQSAQ